jgi:SAM-dependent methyltransferase
VSSTAVDIAAWLRRLPHYLYLVDLLPGKRVLEVGCGTGYGAQFLANHGAGRVVGVDRSLRQVSDARARYRQTNLEFRCEEPGAVELEDGSFDCIFVPEGVEVLRRRTVLAELRRLLVRQGHLVLCGLSADRRGAPGGASFYEFRDRLERLFPPVRMIAQSPFVGFSLVEYADDGGSPGIELDTSLCEVAGGEAEPSEYVAVCGGAGMSLRGFTIVQLPDREGVQPVTAAITGSEAPAARGGEPAERTDDPVVARELRSRLEMAIEERARAQELIEDLRSQVEELRGQLVVESTGTASVPPAGDPEAPSATEKIAEALGAHREVVRSLEIAVEEGQVYADELRGELEQAQAAAQRNEAARRSAEARAARFEAELREWRTRASVAEGQLMRASRGTGTGTGTGGGNGALGHGDRVRVAELENELARVRTDCRESEQRLEEAARAASQAASRAERERDDLAVRLEQVKSEHPSSAATRPAREGEVTNRLARLEGELGTGRDLLRQIEDGLTALEKEAARESIERAPSAWAAHRDQQLRELSAELGVKDAEITILHVGVSALRARIKDLVNEVRRAAGSMRGRSAAEMLEVMDGLTAHLAAFEERE